MTDQHTPAPADPITMTYRNYRGEVDERTIIPVKLWHGKTDWHPKPGWLLTAFDVGKDAERDFALADCQFAVLAPTPTPAVPDDVATVCVNCGSSMTDVELEAWRAEKPGVRVSCCPERKMGPLTREVYDEHHDQCKAQSDTIEAQSAELARLREVLTDILSWFDGGPSSYGPWIIKAGERGADEAVEAARAALAPPTGD